MHVLMLKSETSSRQTLRKLPIIIIIIICPVVGITVIFLVLIVCLVAGLFLDERISLAEDLGQ